MRRRVSIVVGVFVVALIVGYSMWMSLGMPGTDSQLAPVPSALRIG
jgi:hypothetical protein